MKSKKGIAETSALFFYTIVLSAIASIGSLTGQTVMFGGGTPVPGAFLSASNALIIYSNMPHVKRDFREKKAMEEYGYSKTDVKNMTDDQLLLAVKDTCSSCATSGRSDQAFQSVGMLPRLGG